MKTILCPIDSSYRSDHLIHYVGDLAKDTQSKIYLIDANVSARKELALKGTNLEKPARFGKCGFSRYDDANH
jgi:hypothetical protein